jgi:hypothetical protein
MENVITKTQLAKIQGRQLIPSLNVQLAEAE